MKKSETVKSIIIGFAVADALGVPAEFKSREELQVHPITEMEGHGTHDVPKGSWSDDTSMTLCTLNSITASGEVDLDGIMLEFSKWLEDGYMTPHGEVFDIGRTCLTAMRNYWVDKDIRSCGGKNEYDNGNGSLMRIIPVSLYNYFKGLSADAALENIHAVSAITHAHERSCIACGIYDFVLREIIAIPDKASVKTALKKAEVYYREYEEAEHYKRIFSDKFEFTDILDIKSSGYVVDTLEAAIWCLLTTDNYKECVLKAVNLGEDTDTVAAIAGGLAGALYGCEQIPTEWTEVLAKKDDIIKMCDDFYLRLTEELS